VTLPFRLKYPEDSPAPTQGFPAPLNDDDPSDEPRAWLNQPINEDVISALTEAQVLEVLGKFGAIQTALIRYFEPHRSVTERRDLARIALVAAQAGTVIAHAISGGTMRGGRR
jgi:hypothetical protein